MSKSLQQQQGQQQGHGQGQGQGQQQDLAQAPARREEEYTDYSCSTAIERLSRDVETILRAWHVDRGSDHHVTTSSSIHGSSNGRQRSSSVAAATSGGDRSLSSVRLIRSDCISWNLALTTRFKGRCNLTIDLELALWDAPGEIGSDDGNGGSSGGSSRGTTDYSSSQVVKSLQRKPFGKMPAHDFLFDNFSTLFGIGQHISLSPIQPSPIPWELMDSLGTSILERHDGVNVAPWMMASTLSGWLQNSLNIAAANCRTCIPVFGVWGLYRPDELVVHTEDESIGGVQLFPRWAQAIKRMNFPPELLVQTSYRNRNVQNHHFSPPFVVGSVLTPSSSGSHNKNDMIPSAAAVLASNARLAIWAGVLLQHCPKDAMVVLEGARHVFGCGYGYYYGQGLSPSRRLSDWRIGGYDEEDDLAHHFDFDDNNYYVFYTKQCQEYVQDVYEEAWGCKDRRTPLWGSIDDPVKSVYATTTWNGKTSPTTTTANEEHQNDKQVDEEGTVVEPLLTFPLRIRSRRELSKRDWAEMEESVERTILDPGVPSRFCVQAYYDRETSVSTLAANQRCVLAALVRATTLPNETVLHHLTDANLVSRWDDAAGRRVAAKIAERSHVGNGTRKIIDAMDWSNAVYEIISVREAEYVVHAVMNGSLTAGIPSSPEGFQSENSFLSPFRKSAPWGRLLSVLFAHMARLRSLPSMALVWRVFCQELRRRWDERESLPNMQYVPGLDPPPLDLKKQRCFSTIEPMASFSAFLNCSEPDPDDYNCLIGQKLQKKISNQLNDSSTDNGNNNVSAEKADYGPPTIDRDMDFWVMDEPTNYREHDRNLPMNASDDTNFDYVGPPPNDLGGSEDNSGKMSYEDNASKQRKRKNKHFILEGIPMPWRGPKEKEISSEASDESVGSTGTLSQVYFDAAEAGSIFSAKRGFITLDTVLDVKDSHRRPGARCPVADMAINSTGDQLYAPYLQRPHPLTDDVALQRRIMLSKSDEVREKKGALKGRLELAHRLQRPKLMSDMSSFKAANPKCTIEDFTRWYGNPGSPFDDYNTDDLISDEISVQSAFQESAAKKLDKASEAMRVLVSTRDFWSQCWEQSLPVPAAEQHPLFDHVSTVEMVIDYLEQLHPANLMNQVMAVNLSSAYFALASSAKATMKIGIVQLSLKRLRQKTEKALKLLSHDSLGNLSQINDSIKGSTGSTVGTTSGLTSSVFASDQAICACEDVCNALSVTETMIARATSLLHKFPNQYKLVSDLLRFADGSTLSLTDRDGRSNFLNLVFDQQQKENKLMDPSKDRLPNPMLREYVFRNLDDENPCQLAVRFGDEVTNLDRGENEGGVLLALSKSYYHKNQ
eukprot:jgi/Psemu1/208354/e_gw1.466.49.1